MFWIQKNTCIRPRYTAIYIVYSFYMSCLQYCSLYFLTLLFFFIISKVDPLVKSISFCSFRISIIFTLSPLMNSLQPFHKFDLLKHLFYICFSCNSLSLLLWLNHNHYVFFIIHHTGKCFTKNAFFYVMNGLIFDFDTPYLSEAFDFFCKCIL